MSLNCAHVYDPILSGILSEKYPKNFSTGWNFNFWSFSTDHFEPVHVFPSNRAAQSWDVRSSPVKPLSSRAMRSNFGNNCESPLHVIENFPNFPEVVFLSFSRRSSLKVKVGSMLTDIRPSPSCKSSRTVWPGAHDSTFPPED